MPNAAIVTAKTLWTLGGEELCCEEFEGVQYSGVSARHQEPSQNVGFVEVNPRFPLYRLNIMVRNISNVVGVWCVDQLSFPRLRFFYQYSLQFIMKLEILYIVSDEY